MAKSREPKETIFTLLERKQVCYAVVVSNIKYRMMAKQKSKYSKKIVLVDKTEDECYHSIDNQSREYVIIVTKQDSTRHRLPRFVCTNSQGVEEYELNEIEIADFKSRANQFNKVLHNSDGRVFELKNNPFKPHFNEQNVYEVVGQTSN